MTHPHSIFSGLAMILAAAPLAQGQSYVFSSCSSHVAFRANFSVMRAGSPVLLPGGGRSYNYILMGNYSLTVGKTRQVSTGLGAASILYTAVGDLPPFTTFLFEAPNAAGEGPGKGAGAATREWRVTLQGNGDLLPAGLPAALPGLPAWTFRTQNYIFGDGRALAQIDTFGACPAPNGKEFGDPEGPGVCACGEPINVGNGNVFEKITDYQTAGPNPLSFIRYYNSLPGPDTFAASLGAGWRSNFDRYLRIDSATSVTAERPDGKQLTFTLNGSAWTSDTDVDVKLARTGTTWTLTDTDDTVETYRTASATQGLLQSIRARNGYTQNLQYNASNQPASVTDSFNRQLAFSYLNGTLQSVTTPDGLILTYGYSTSGGSVLLVSTGYSTSPPTSQTYVYENTAQPAALTGVIDENGNRFNTWTYDASGRALSSQHAGGADLTTIAYNDSDGSRTVTYPLGAQAVYRFSMLQGIPKVTGIDRLATASTPAAAIRFTYDNNGYLASRTDWNGNRTTFVNDPRGQPVTIVEAAGTPQARTTAVTYHTSFHLPLTIVQPGRTSSFTYDVSGNLLTRTQTDTTANTAPYSTNGTSRTWTYTWSNFLPASVKGPRSDVAAVTRFTYDSSGALTATTNALNQTTRISQHTPGGLPLTVVDPNGVTTNLVYDLRLRLISRAVLTAAGPLNTRYAYDAAGNPVGVTLPDGSTLTRTFDVAHRLTGIADLFNQSIAYTLDPLGGVVQTKVLDAAGTPQLARSASFDPLGRMVQETGGSGQTTGYSYDANGNLLAVTSALNRVAQRLFDPLNRPVKITDMAGGVVTLAYDARGRLASVTDPNGATTAFVYNGFDDLIQRSSPDGGTTVYRYDVDGNLIQRTDPNGSVINYSYDALDRMIAASYPGNPGENITYSYDTYSNDQASGGFGAGRLTGFADAAGAVTRSYDERGNLLSEKRASGSSGLAAGYTYDAAGRIASIAYPSGWTAAYARDAMGRVTSLTAISPDGSVPAPVLTSVVYQPFGPANAVTFGNGVVEGRAFDLDYRLTRISGAGGNAIEDLTYAYDGNNNVLSIADGVNAVSSQSFTYDPLDRLTGATGAYGQLGYTYDALGNRLTEIAGGATARTYSYPARSNRIAALASGDGTLTLGYDKAGNLNRIDPPLGAITGFTYNQEGRLASVNAGSDLLAQYTYDGFSRRLVKTGAVTGTTYYQYDSAGHVLEETGGPGSALADYLYLGDRPVAVLAPASGQVYFLHNDRLGAPQTATDSSQNPVWTAAYGPFGEMSTVPSLIVQNLRLPGQEYDADTGLYHNGFRNYAPAWGRYIESDPIGLAGGLNIYAYALGNPLKRVDPYGLFCSQAYIAYETAEAVDGLYDFLKGATAVAVGTAADATGVLAGFGITAQTLGVVKAAWGETKFERARAALEECKQEDNIPPYRPQCPNALPPVGIEPVVGRNLNAP